MPAIKTHRTETSTDSWDGPANKTRALTDQPRSYFAGIFAWYDPEKDERQKTSYRFIHHFVSEDGKAGAASTVACSAGIAVLNGARGGTTIPDADRRSVYNHLAAHLRDADIEPPELKAVEVQTHEEKAYKCELKEIQDSGEFEGVASVLGNVDLVGDVMHPGSFSRTVQAHKGRFPLLDSHRSPIGVAEVEETANGLKVHGYLNLEKQGARERYADLKFYRSHGMPMGMSFGFDTVKADNEGGVRNVREVKLWEVSITEFPANPLAQVTSVKAVSVDEAKAAVTFDGALDATQTYAARYQMCSALLESLDSIVYDGDLSPNDKVAASAESISQFSASYVNFLPKFFALLESRYKSVLEAWETKAGRRISTASRERIEAAIKELQALLEEADSTANGSDSASDTEASGKSTPPPDPPQPQSDSGSLHSDLKQVISELKERFPCLS